MASQNGLNSPFPLPVSKGGTGLSSFPPTGILLGGATTAQTLQLLDGQIPIGVTGSNPSPAYLSAGPGVAISVAPGSIQISSAPSNFFVGFQHIFGATTMTFGPGQCTTSDNMQNLQTFANFSKTTATFSPGNLGGGFPSGVPISLNSSYLTFIISKPTGEIDFGFDTSQTATNLLVTAGAFGFTRYRRIGAIRTQTSTSNIEFMINDGDYFLFGTSRNDFSLVNPPYQDTTYTINTSCPTQINLIGLIYVSIKQGAYSNIVYGFVCSYGTSNLSNPNLVLSIGNNTWLGSANLDLIVDLSRVLFRVAFYGSGSATGQWSLYTNGWIDDRSIL